MSGYDEKTGHLSDEQRSQLLQHMTRTFGCKHTQMAAHGFSAMRLLPDPTQDEIGSKRPTISCVVLVCVDCGELRLFNAIIAGVVEKDRHPHLLEK